MSLHASTVAPLRILLPRAIVGYVILRALLLVVSLLAAEFVGREAADFDNPLGIVVLAVLLGAADIRRRGESTYWANLGYPALVTRGLFGVVALLAEGTLLAVRGW